MKLKIVFKDKTETVVDNFTKITFLDYNAELKTINSDEFTDFQLVDGAITYKFIGTNTVTTLGSNILYLDLE